MGPTNIRSTGQLPSRRSVLMAGAAGGLALATVRPGLAARAADGFALVSGHQPAAAISIAPGASAHAQHCAAALRDHVAAGTGATLDIVTGEPSTGVSVLYIDWLGVRAPSSVPALLAGLDADGFVMAVEPTAAAIIGNSTYGSEFGVYEFLERHLDVRWLAPSDQWKVTPTSVDVVIPVGSEAQAPSFGDRILSPYAWPIEWDSSSEWYQWTNRSRLRRRDGALGYGHNLYRVFPPATFAADHPEFYPILNGQRHIPTTNDKAGWQPRFTAPGTVDAAVAYIRDILTRRADLPAMSLGINDSGNFSEDERQYATISPSGRWSYSELYYAWVNEVAEQLAPDFPDRAIGVLAYSAVEEPPSFDLHPMVRPVLCRDFQALSRPDTAAEWHDLHQRWADRSASLGTWAYAYGGNYALPRIQLHNDAAALHALRETYDVDRLHIEMQPEWGEGPKPWVYTRLAWDHTSDPDDLLNDWCLHAVGAQAAPYLADYFRAWEQIWDTKVTATEWFDLGSDNPYYYFDAPGYLEAVTPADLPPLVALLDQAIANSAPGSQRERAEFLRRTMDYYGAVVQSYPRDHEPATTTGQALKLVKDALAEVDAGIAADQVRRTCLVEFRDDELTSRTASAVTNGMAWSGINLYRAWRIADHLTEHEPTGGAVTHCLTRHTGIGTTAQRDLASWILSLAHGHVVARGHNPGFEDGLEAWTLSSAVAPREEIDRAESPTFDGTGQSLRVPGGARVMLNQSLTDVTPGPLFTRMRCLSTAEVTGEATPEKGSAIRVYWRLYNTAGALIERRSGRLFPLASAHGQWQEIRMADVLPDNIGRVMMTYEFRPMTVAATAYLDAGEILQLTSGA